MDGASDKIGPQNPINLSGTNADLGDASANVAASADHLNNTIGIPRKSSSIRNEFLPISPGSRIEARSSEDSNPESSPSKSPSTLNGRDTQDVKEEGQNGSIDKRRTESIPSSGHEIRAAVSPGDEDWSNLQQILSNIFGRARQAVSEEEQTRHVGVIWRNLTVKGVGVGATLQPTNSDLILGPFRFLWRLVTGKARRKKPVRTILDDLTVCRPFIPS